MIYLLPGASPGPGEALRVLAVLAAVTLAGTAVVLLAVRALLAPVGMASAALEGYLEDRTTPELPAGFVPTRPHALRREVAWGGVAPERDDGLAVRSFPGGEFARAGIGGPFRRHRVTE